MKFFSMRWLVLASLIGFGATGIVSSNVGCGDSDATGSGGSGGGAGGSGGAVVPRYADTFDTDKEMWQLSDYVDANYKNLGAASAPDSGVSLDGGMVPTLEWSGACGDPSPGMPQADGDLLGVQGVRRSAGPDPDSGRLHDRWPQHRARAHPPGLGNFPGGRHSVPRVERPDRAQQLRLRVGAVRQRVEPGRGGVDADHARHQRRQHREPAPRVRSVADRADRHPVHHGRSVRRRPPAFGQAVFEIDTISG